MPASRYAEALVGRERSRSARGFAAGFGVFLLALVFSWGIDQVVDLWWGHGWLIGLVVILPLVGAYAYWNDGLLVGLWLAATTAFAMYWGFAGAPPLTGHLVLWGLSGWTLITAMPYGVMGYIGGRMLWRRRHQAADTDPASAWLVDLLAGRDLRRSGWLLALAIGLLVAGFGLMLVVHEPWDVAALQRQLAIRDYFRLADLLHLRTEWRYIALLAWIGLPAALAFWNDGYVPIWVLVFGGAYGVNVGNRFTQDPDLVQAIFDPLLQVLVHAFFLGTIGFGIGAGLRRAVGFGRHRRAGPGAGSNEGMD